MPTLMLRLMLMLMLMLMLNADRRFRMLMLSDKGKIECKEKLTICPCRNAVRSDANASAQYYHDNLRTLSKHVNVILEAEFIHRCVILDPCRPSTYRQPIRLLCYHRKGAMTG